VNRQKEFYPDYLIEILLVIFFIVELIVTLALLFPPPIGRQIDFSAPFSPKPEWYFLFMFQVFKFLPGEILFLPGEFVGIVLFGIGILLWAIVPVWDRKTSKGNKNTLLTYFGIFVIIFIIVFTILGFILD